MDCDELHDGLQCLADVEVRALVLVRAKGRHLAWRRSRALDRVEDLDAAGVGDIPERWRARSASGESGTCSRGKLGWARRPSPFLTLQSHRHALVGSVALDRVERRMRCVRLVPVDEQ